MVPAEVQEELLDVFKELSPENGNRLLEMARSMKTTRMRGSRIEDIMRNIIPMDHESAEEMRRIIEEGCEQIDESQW